MPTPPWLGRLRPPRGSTVLTYEVAGNSIRPDPKQQARLIEIQNTLIAKAHRSEESWLDGRGRGSQHQPCQC